MGHRRFTRCARWPLAGAMALALVVAAALLAAAALALASAQAHTANAAAEPEAHFDPAEGVTRLDLFGARFGQTAQGDLALVVRTHKPWVTDDVNPAPTRGLCIWLRADASTAPGGRLCVVPDKRTKSALILRYTALDADGNRLGIRNLSVAVRRPRPTMISASFSPALLRLVPGLYHWQVRSLSPPAAEDRLPNGDVELPLRIAVSSAPAARQRCFGAASRDPYRRCVNRGLRTAIVPAPDEAVFSQNSPCTPLPFDGELAPCEFGVPAADARGEIALLGDSHASHWRAALEVVTQRKRWRGTSITRSGCPVMLATTRLTPLSRREGCARWNAQIPAWFAKHPQVHTAFVVQHWAGDVVIPRGSTERETKVKGFIAAWRALPSTVKRIVVIRDTPIIGFDALGCVRRAKAKRRNAGSTCAVKRSLALLPDPAVTAARRLNSPRVRVVDMTRFLCSAKRCFPVIGGALVYKDDQHLTEVFASTLGPYLLGAINRVL